MSSARTKQPDPMPTLIVPRGRAPARPRPLVQTTGSAPMLSKTQVLALARSFRPVEVVFPWATLTAGKPFVAGRAELTMWSCFAIGANESHQEIKLTSGPAGADAQVWVWLKNITPGQLFVVELNGWRGGSGGVLRCETKTGSTEVALSSTSFNLPVAVTDTNDDALLKVKVKSLPTGGLALHTIKVWKVD